MTRNYRKWILVGAVWCCLSAPMAIAGPKEDTDAAAAAFARSDLMSAMALWRKAAKEGYAPAQVRLADMLDDGEEDKEAVDWYRKAAGQGNAAGEYGLGVMYFKGEGVEKDLEKARLHILRSANQNYLPAMRLAMEFYKTGGAGLPTDLVEAAKWEDKMYAVSGRSKPAPKPAPNLENKR